MDFSIEDLLDDTDWETQRKPCRTCRRRKVRCSKTEPCSNCQRANIVCEYDENQGDSTAALRTEHLARRISELEAIIHRYEEEQRRAAGGVPQKISISSSTLAQSPFAAERIALDLYSTSSGAMHAASNLLTRPNGKLVLDGTASRHVQSTFWASMYDEIEDLKFLVREEKAMPSHISWLRPPVDPNLPPISLMLSPAHSEYLVRAYISRVDQSVRILHKPTVLKQVNFWWRGVLADFHDFECQLAVIYCLALLSISPQDCEERFGQSREALATKLHAQAEKGLAMLSIATTHKLTALQTFTLYITYVFMTGKTLLASSLLALAIRTAQRIGIHRDGTHYNLNPWQTETRRRLWHHILLLDTWCTEHLGLESSVPIGFSDTKLPLNVNDAAWDVSEFSNQEPVPQSGFTDNTFALVQYEAAALMRLDLDRSISSPGTGEIHLHPQLQMSFWEYIERTYLAQLDSSQAQQNLILEVAHLTKERTTLWHTRLSNPNDDNFEALYGEDESRLLTDAVNYCKHVQAAVSGLSPANLEWVIIRAFCWHSLMIMLSTTLRKHGVTRSADAQWALQRLVSLFQDRPTIEYLKQNEILWHPIEKLMSELFSRYGEVNRQMEQEFAQLAS